MKIWIDDARPAPVGYKWCKSVQEALIAITQRARTNFIHKNGERIIDRFFDIEVIDIDHDAGDYKWQGGDYIEILDWLEYQYRVNKFKAPPIRIHSMNPVGRKNMEAIIKRNNWRLIR